ncbi:glycosyltransferase [uncultured Lamprocystis sp.]|jgi:cellulose synthase/poly-beta-1,6-N-acetylglucosamine synthase-like glycosyltransferase|uniref:glycosyltransferase n=1 Tax=uncultured Lamprocystis sp. TaxID=543132 RepID=UPI0025E01234|nr:glycosyltransferase [uncultured Lamprocystis sp.]
MLASVPALDHLITVGLIVLSALSLNLVVLAAARLLAGERRSVYARLDGADLPQVLVQVPLYNEGPLVRRILGAVAAFDWPRDRLRIQVLDDSTDGSCALSRQAVADLKRQGFRIELLHRTHRTAFKAGALAAGLKRCAAPYVAIFDADFIPPPDFLRRTLAVLEANPAVAYAQARWTHLNAPENLLTRIQARLLDAHFRVEQEARWRLGLFLPFNGTCGVWRRAAIDDAGGWQGDTLTEDLDLSVRARLRGWRAAFLIDLTVPGALPASVPAWRAQQFRWNKGFVQCALKLTPRVWRSSALSFRHKLMLTLEMAQPLAYLIGASCILLGLPYIAGAAVAGPTLAVAAVWASLVGVLGTVGFLLLGTTRENRSGAPLEIVAALFLSTGLLISNARAGLEALVGHRSEFVRTPKSTAPAAVAAKRRRYGMIEAAAGIGLLGFALLEQPAAVLYLTLVIGGLIAVGVMQLLDGRDLPKLARLRQ